MEKYNGNQKGFIYVSCDAKDQKEVLEKYLEPLAAAGVSFWWADDAGDAGGALNKGERRISRGRARCCSF